MINRKSLIRKLLPGVAVVITSVVLMLGILWASDSVTKRLPVSASQLRPAQESVTRNEDWKPVIRNFNNLDWALVPAGCFQIGSTETQFEQALNACKTYGGENCPYVFDMVEEPGSQVCFEQPYWIGATEVTNHEYGSSSSTEMVSMYRGPNWPRETVAWQEALSFCESIGSRLPTEAEWEYAARGPDGLIYPWGNEMKPAYRQEAEMLSPQDVKSVDIDMSWVGARGLSGNVMEWTADAFDPDSTPNQNITKASQGGDQRVVRGGSWASYTDFLVRTTQRLPYDPDFASSVIGFRCVHNMEGTP